MLKLLKNLKKTELALAAAAIVFIVAQVCGYWLKITYVVCSIYKYLYLLLM